MLRLIAGLGNPGPDYEATRHNAGFWWLDEIACKLGMTLQSDRAYQARVARLNRTASEGGPLWLVEPQTFMNLSGKSVAGLARFFKIDPQQVLVAHDELDLPPGEIKLKQGGGHGGHNGLRDIHAQLGSSDYWRLRIGIGHPGVKTEVMNYVLGKPPAAQREAIEAALARATGVLDSLLAGEMARATSALHTTKPPRPKPPRPEGLAPKAGGEARQPVDPAAKDA